MSIVVKLVYYLNLSILYTDSYKLKMCGIWGYVEIKAKHHYCELFQAFMEVQKRGPDGSNFRVINEFIKIYLGFHRLAIMDRSTDGDQPFTLEIKDAMQHRSVYAICNGEIYNFKHLVTVNKFILKSRSDCEFLPLMYAKYGFKGTLEQLRGEFAICMIDIDHMKNNIQVFVGRDQTAVRPAYIGIDENGIGISSTLAGLVKIIAPKNIRQLNRAELIHINITDEGIDINPVIYHTLVHQDDMIITRNEDENKIDLEKNLKILAGQILENKYDPETMLSIFLKKMRTTLVDAVTCRLESERPIGALLSGGLDSSLVVAIASTHLKKIGKRLRTFSIGIPGSTDKAYAEMVAKYCGTDHTHVEFTQDEFLNAISQVINATETYDITTVRASVGQYLISRWIRDNTNIKVLLIGDGSDELLAGYMYFHNAPSPGALADEIVRLIENMKCFDLQRSDRCIAYNGIEARCPYLDILVVMLVMLVLRVEPTLVVPCQEGTGRNVEKWFLRKAFDCKHIDAVKKRKVNWLPAAVLWRQKEAFSDGVSSREKSWYQIIQENVNVLYCDKDFEDMDVRYHLVPPTKEALHYKIIFGKHFHPHAASVIPYYWMPRWCGNAQDPSARVLKVYDQGDDQGADQGTLTSVPVAKGTDQ
jgi:asparagine synthase (glutamine-hydrolysing)